MGLRAQNLFDGVHRIFEAAKEEGYAASSWKIELLDLLCGSLTGASSDGRDDIDVLLENQNCGRFVLRCIEQELPPTLVYCLRLLRVIELHIAESNSNLMEGRLNDDTGELNRVATTKVRDLLCLLCVDSNVGEILRPHLFRLLALPGGLYPLNGVHIAEASSSIIISYSKACLSTSIVQYLHECEMIILMTEDIKVLCGMTEESNSLDVECLTGFDAETAGLWVVSLKTVVHLVTNSCKHNCVELIQDFDAAGGYHVLSYAILHASETNTNELLKLLTMLVCCKTKLPDAIESIDQDDDIQLVTNIQAFNIIQDLMINSLPFLKTYAENHQGKLPEFRIANLNELVTSSLSFKEESFVSINSSRPQSCCLMSELLIMTLQHYSDHRKNYDIIEPNFNILSLYLLSYPTLSDEFSKSLVLKTLEYVCTGIPGSDSKIPLQIASEIFAVMCNILLSCDQGTYYESIKSDIELLCDTLEKLMLVHENLAEIMYDCGFLDEKMNSFLSIIVSKSEKSPEETKDNGVFSANHTLPGPPQITAMDEAFGLLCRLVKVMICQQFEKDDLMEIGRHHEQSHFSGRINLHVLLTMGITSLGDNASNSALSVFEAILTDQKAAETLQDDVSCLIDVLEQLNNATKKRYPNYAECFNGFDTRSMLRQIKVIKVFEISLQTNAPVHEIFRNAGGFECIIRTLHNMKDIFIFNNRAVSNKNSSEDLSSNEIITLFSAVFSLISVAIGSTSTGSKDSPVCQIKNFSSMSAFKSNKRYLDLSKYYGKLSEAITCTGILNIRQYALFVSKLALQLIESDVSISKDDTLSRPVFLQFISNPGAICLVLEFSLNLSKDLLDLSKKLLDQILSLCAPDRIGTTLPQLAKSELVFILTNQNKFRQIIGDQNHPLHSRFLLLLRRVAGYNMSYKDFISLLRYIGAPILLHDTESSNRGKGRIVIPVISSSIQTSSEYNPKLRNDIETNEESFQTMEADFCARLENLAVIAQKRDRVSRCILGGDNLNTVALYMQKVPVEERFQHLAKQDRVKYILIKSIDSTARTLTSTMGSATATSATSGDKVWSAFASSGFSFSLWLRLPSNTSASLQGSLFLLDLSSNPNDVNVDEQTSMSMKSSSVTCDFLSIWYDIQNQQICVLTSATPRNIPETIPLSPLSNGVWHHMLITYQPPKRSIVNKKASVFVHIDGRFLSSEVKVENVNLPPTSSVHIGVPNPIFAASGIVRDSLVLWELGPCLFVTEALTSRDATSIFSAGPEFKGLFWGDRPQRLSSTATATATFAMLAEIEERGSVASALRKRNIADVELSGQVIRGKSIQNDSLSSAGLLCSLSSDRVVFGFNAYAHRCSDNEEGFQILVNIARINNNNRSTDALLYGNSSIIDPVNFADNLQWIGGPKMLLPLVNAVKSSSTLALTLRVIRESSHCHLPNLENLQIGGGYRILGLLLRQKLVMDASVMDECFAFGVHGFKPGSTTEGSKKMGNSEIMIPTWSETEQWVLTDLHAIKYLLLNHQVWDLRKSGPKLTLRLLAFFNALVSSNNFHAAFNSRRLHLLGIVKWTIHLMLEAAALYDNVEDFNTSRSAVNESQNQRTSSGSLSWQFTPPSLKNVSLGSDPDNAILKCCKFLLRRVLTFMLTPNDLRDIASAIMYTASINNKMNAPPSSSEKMSTDAKIRPGPVTRIYLLRLLEDLVIDGVNEIISANAESATNRRAENSPSNAHSNAGGSTNTNQSYLASTMGTMRRLRSNTETDNTQHPKHQQAQAFLSAFASILTPVWFACVLEGCHEEASASASLRLLVLLLQSSPTFCAAFEHSNGFSPLVLSIPKFSTSPSIIMVLLSQLLRAPILNLPNISGLDASMLMEVFDVESDTIHITSLDTSHRKVDKSSDPSCGIFALLAECLGRNIQFLEDDNMGRTAKETNEAVIRLLSHRHSFSSYFQEFCRTPDFLEPLAQALCLVHDSAHNKEGLPNNIEGSPDFVSGKTERRGSLKSINSKLSPTQRFIGEGNDALTSSGYGMVNLLHLVLSHAVRNGQPAVALLSDLFKSFPIHASLVQVEAYHLVLIEHCSTVAEDALQRGEPLAIANCIGLSSVLLDRLMTGFFTSEPVLKIVEIILKTLRSLTASGTYASRTLDISEQSLLVADTAHLARLSCLTALKRSCPRDEYDEGDSDLKFEILKKISANLRQLLLVPGTQNAQSGKRGQSSVTESYSIPAPGTKMRYLYQFASLSRYLTEHDSCNYPDLHDVHQPDRAFVAALMSAMYETLCNERIDIREQAVEVVVSLLTHRKVFMAELLIADINHTDDKAEVVDLMNRGGFGALLVAHEAATIAENISTVPRRTAAPNRKISPGGKRKYASFFEWLERNKAQVDAVFGHIYILSNKLLPKVGAEAASPEEAIENEQKIMLLRMTAQDTSDKTILGGLERVEKAHDLHEKTARSHAAWKRQGFDDLSSGAMKWKMLLRQLKGAHSIWEGDFLRDDEKMLPPNFTQNVESEIIDDKEVSKAVSQERWKLNLSEGYERQRRRLIPNHEFQKLYNLDKTTYAMKNDDLPALAGKFQSNSGVKESKSNTSNMAENSERRHSTFFVQSEEIVDATAALLREMRLRTNKGHNSIEKLYVDDDDDSSILESFSDGGYSSDEGKNKTSLSSQPIPKTTIDDLNANNEEIKEENNVAKDNTSNEKKENDEDDKMFASSYDVITGILEPGEWPEKSYNVKRCTGLEVRDAILLWCPDSIYVVDGFEKKEGDGLEGKINRLEKSTSTFHISLRPDNFVSIDQDSSKENDKVENSRYDQNEKSGDLSLNNENKGGESHVAGDEVTYQHSSRRIAFSDMYSVYRRRYQLQQIALEFFDIHRNGTLLAFSSQSEREEVLTKVLSSPLPNSIFSMNNHFGTNTINYDKFMDSLRVKITNDWVQGRVTNFDFLMHLNSFAGRTYNDLTQYPVFPWVLSDYESSEIDLSNPKSYRDLSKPMGAQGEERVLQYKERFEVLESNTALSEDEPPPFHYGTHYSCAAYVLYYLMRLEPFSRLALSLQGGRFDVADRLFHCVRSSWLSASAENLQDVRELIPEFFYFPEFLENRDMFDFGKTQSGKVVHHVILPPWADGDPRKFVRINRQVSIFRLLLFFWSTILILLRINYVMVKALESEYVSKHLHNWIDLIFGYKQRGREAVKALNTFVHLTYEGQVDLDDISDPIERESTIAQIHNFGQTPSRLVRKPFPERNVFVAVKDKNIDVNALSNLAALFPSLCVIGAPHRVQLRAVSWDTCRVGMAGQLDSSVGDIILEKGQLIGAGRTCCFFNPQKRFYYFGGLNNGVRIHVGVPSAKNREVNQVLSIHDGMHRYPISIARPSQDGRWLITGCYDSTVRVWKYNQTNMYLEATLCGHDGGSITCLDVSTTDGTIVTGDANGKVLVWDLRSLSYVRQLMTKSILKKSVPSSFHDEMSSPNAVISVSINNKNGNVLTLIATTLTIFDINGNMLGRTTSSSYDNHNRPSCALATGCPEWMEQGIVAVTGHMNGDVRLWSLDYKSKILNMRHLAPDRVHSCPITCLRIPGYLDDTLLVGDKSGKVSEFKSMRIDNFSQQEQSMIIAEMKSGVCLTDDESLESNSSDTDENELDHSWGKN